MSKLSPDEKVYPPKATKAHWKANKGFLDRVTGSGLGKLLEVAEKSFNDIQIAHIDEPAHPPADLSKAEAAQKAAKASLDKIPAARKAIDDAKQHIEDEKLFSGAIMEDTKTTLREVKGGLAFIDVKLMNIYEYRARWIKPFDDAVTKLKAHKP